MNFFNIAILAYPIRWAINGFILLLIALFSAAICCHALAQPPLIITERGYFFVQLGPDGLPQNVQITNVIDMRDGDKDPDPPDEGDMDEAVVAKVKEWAASAEDPGTAQGIAAVYSHVRGAVADGIVETSNAWDKLATATDKAMQATGADAANWKPFRDGVSAIVTEGMQRGTLGSVASVKRLLLSVQHGLELAADGSAALELDILTRIAATTNEAIDDKE